MKNLALIITLLIIIILSACGPSLEEGPCTNRIKLEYEATLGWFIGVSSKAATYDSYDEYLEVYNKPLENWKALEPITTCDSALIDLMVHFLTMDPDDVDKKEAFEDILFFDLDIMHTGK